MPKPPEHDHTDILNRLDLLETSNTNILSRLDVLENSVYNLTLEHIETLELINSYHPSGGPPPSGAS